MHGKNDQDKKWGKTDFSKALSIVFLKFWFLNFVDISIEKFAGINIAIAVTQPFSISFLKFMCT